MKFFISNKMSMLIYALCYLPAACLCISSQLLFADPPAEGMWLPMLLGESNMTDMRAAGLKLSAEDIYSVNHSSMKDAVLLFGSGCTGAVISNEGLLITNHHCGFGQVQSHSSVDHDYITNGFWAMSHSEELTCPGLTVTFIISMEDITAAVMHVLKDGISESRRNDLIDSVSGVLAAHAVRGTNYRAQVKSFYSGNQFFLILSETFRDIRLVGIPPISIGNFGGETDNWIWPRHTGDFSLFRIYAGKDNAPADYSTDNIPYRPRYFFPVSLKGVKENDFTMVYGFPGRTNEYAPSFAIDLAENISDPNRVKVRDKILGTWWTDMLASDTVRIQYSSKYYGLGNAWKKWQGEIRGLKKAGAVEKKEEYENEFLKRVSSNAAFNAEYGNVLEELKGAYDSVKVLEPLVDYYEEALNAPEIFHFAITFESLIKISQDPKSSADAIHAQAEKLKAPAAGFYKNYHASTDEKVMKEVMALYDKNISFTNSPAELQVMIKNLKGNPDAFAHWLFNNSFLDNQDAVMNFLNAYKKGDEKKVLKDPAYELAVSISEYGSRVVYPDYNRLRSEINTLSREYMAAQMEVMKEKKFYPDANLTLRLTYGKAEGYEPNDGVHYEYHTTLKGVMEKMNPDIQDYKVPEKLKSLYEKKEFGDYADASGEIHPCFIASNHTTGGNSGSPVVNGTGELIGVNFDRVWEGTMSDLYFDPNECRNISLDIRYALFIIDKYAGAGYLLNEMLLKRP